MSHRALWLVPLFGALVLACPKDDNGGAKAPAADAGASGDAAAATGPDGGSTPPTDGCAYTLLKVPVIPATVNVLNELGQIGGSVDGHRPFIWSEGKDPYYFEDTGAPNGEVFDLDDQGHAVGVLEGATTDATGHKCELQDCGMVWYPPGSAPGPNGWQPGWNLVTAQCPSGAIARAIASSGWIIGLSGCTDPYNVQFMSPFQSPPLNLPAACEPGVLSDVNDDFKVVGSCQLKDTPNADVRGVRGKNDAMTVLPSLGGQVSDARRLNASGIAAGMSMRPDGSTAAVYWNDKDELVELPGVAKLKDGFVDDEAYDINDANLIVGMVYIHPNADLGGHIAAAWKDGAFIDLNAAACTRAVGKEIDVPIVGDGYPQYLLESAVAVNNKGQIAVLGEDRTAGGARAVFLLTPR